MTGWRSLLVAGWSASCGWISPEERDRRWDIDRDGVERPRDCDDRDPLVHPDSPEQCDGAGIDEDCDGRADGADPDCEESALPCGELPIAALAVSTPAGEQGVTAFVADASASVGTGLRYRFDAGDGPDAWNASPTRALVLDAVGWLPISVEVQDACGRTSAAGVRVAVGAPGDVLWVDTPLDDEEVDVAGLSLREALVLARDTVGPQVIGFVPDLGPVRLGERMPALSDAGGILIGQGTELVGVGPARLDASGPGAVVAGLVFSGFGGPEGALSVTGTDTILHRLTIRDSHRGIEIRGDGTRIEETTFSGNGGPQLVIEASASLIGVEVSDGDGDGIAVKKEGSGTRIVSSVIRGNGRSGIVVARDARDVAILDTTLLENLDDGLSVDEAEGLDLRNVVLARNGGWGLDGKIRSFAPGAPGHDLWFGNGEGDCHECNPDGEGVLFVDPMLAADGPPIPLPGSPLVDGGTEATGVDRNGPTEGLWFGDGPDIGGIERR
jgi:hypothetical protein